jgi:hypothetical protein
MDDMNENIAYLHCWTFRYWEVRAHDGRGIGSRPVEDMHWVIPLLTFDLKNPNLTTYNLQGEIRLIFSSSSPVIYRNGTVAETLYGEGTNTCLKDSLFHVFHVF